MNDDPRIRVAHITFGLDVGGLEKLLVQFAKHADPNRYQLTVASLGQIGPIGEQLRSMDIPVVCMHRAEGFHPSLVGQLYRFFRKIRADVVHSHDPRPLIYAAPAARLARVRSIVHTQHGRVFGTSPRQQWLVRQASRMVHHFVGVSHDISDMAIDLGVNPKTVSVIQNGIGGDAFESDHPRRSHDERPYVVCVARLSPEKGISTLIQAAEIMVAEHPDVQIIIAGEGPCRRELQSQIDSLGLNDTVRLIGETAQVAELLHRARAFVLPSNSEGVSLTLLEAMFAGVPIVATNVGGTPEVIQNGSNGLLVPAKDPQTMAHAMMELWNDSRLCDNLITEGYRVASTRFGIDQMLRQYEAFYESGRKDRRSNAKVDSGTEAATA
ncbi:Glycogen synthase [Rubripirellula lacrimiformis]|uniref:Glycogen synthase n=1 Tax=Rubripirellula lacrimiformis TaxID=1930273 RepID=A0A517N8E1_9BACT|nr:glycosyltransferase [Rubripirellula lacrimiformis]QDT03406.1 Glycogen synthase [Rubripirellula lacrimiformis]